MRTTEERRERGGEACRRWSAAHPDRVSAKNAAYYAANRDRILAERATGNSPELKRRLSKEMTRRGQTIDGRAARMLAKARGRARDAEVPFALTKEWIAQRLVHPCALTGREFNFTAGSPDTPSLDRIVPSLGYVPSNSRLIIKAANFAKNIWSDEVLYEWAEDLLKNRPIKETIH